jgi:LysM repeat protein
MISLKFLMKFLLTTVTLLAAFTVNAAPRYSNSSNPTSDPFKELRESLDTLRHKVSNHEAEIRMYEDKINNQELIVDSLRQQINTTTQTHQDLLKDNSASLEMKIGALETSSKGLVADLKQLKTHANETTHVLTQLKQKLSELEKTFEAQNENMANLQSAMQSLLAALDVKTDLPPPQALKTDSLRNDSKTYQVKSGDSLEKIARKTGTTIKELKELNGLTKDRIIVGQTLQLP